MRVHRHGDVGTSGPSDFGSYAVSVMGVSGAGAGRSTI
jgi:hypothetical protein